MPSPSGLVIAAGTTAFIGNWKKEDGFPETGYTIIAATIALVFIASFTSGTAFEKPAKAAAGLMLLTAVIKYVPGLMTTKSKGKKNG